MYTDNARNANLNRDFINEFGGFNHNLKIGENEFYGVFNMTSKDYPVLSSRPQFYGSITDSPKMTITGEVDYLIVNAGVEADTTKSLTFTCNQGTGTVSVDALADTKIEINGIEYEVDSNTQATSTEVGTLTVKGNSNLPAINFGTIIYSANPVAFPVGMVVNDDKVWTTVEYDGKLYITDNGSVGVELGTIVSGNLGKERTLINFGAYILVYPDKFFFNTADYTDYGSVEKVFRNIDETNHYNRWYVVKPCDIDGNEFVADSYSATEPDTSDIPDGYIWYDLNEKVIKQWSNSYSMWITPTIYHKYRIQGIGIFKEGDGVKIRRYHDNEEYSMTTSIVKAFSNGEAPVSETPPMDADYIIIPSADDMAIHWRNWNGATTNVTLYNQWRNLLSVEQKTPKMDYICECQGRLWGCRYGETQTDEIRQYRSKPAIIYSAVGKTYTIELNDGETVGEVLTYWLYDARTFARETNATITYTKTNNTITVTVSPNRETLADVCLNVNYTVLKTQKLNEIYASKQQDFKCWDYFQGTALDSYTVNIGASGQFTGCINFNGKPLFSKEDRMFVIYGNYPAQYQLQENMFEGVKRDCEKTMAIYNGVLYYMGRHGIYAYSGGFPIKISSQFADLVFDFGQVDMGGDFNEGHYRLGCSATYDGKYYIMLFDNETFYGGVYTYDIEKGIWHDIVPHDLPMKMVSWENGLLAMCWTEYKIGIKKGVYASYEFLEHKTETPTYSSWEATTGLIGLNTPDEKYITKATMRYKGNCTVKIKYDSTGDWIEVAELSGGTTSKTFDIIPDRCDHFQLRFSGGGEFTLYSIAKTNSAGSDVTYGNV